MIAGKKRLDLFPPHNNEELYEGHIREGQLSFSLETGQFSRTNLLDSTSMVLQHFGSDRRLTCGFLGFFAAGDESN